MTKPLLTELPRLKVPKTSMTKVDRMGWEVGLSLKSYGVSIGVRANESAALDRVYEHLPRTWESTSEPIVDRIYSIFLASNGSRAGAQRFSHLFGDDVRLSRSSDLEDIYERFESDLRIFVAEFAKARVFVHAGVVGWKGRAIVVPGRSFSGKSSLVAALVRAGATYYSDEYAVFDSRGRVHPYAKPIELREQGKPRQTKFDVSELGGFEGVRPLPVGMVVLTQFQEGAKWRPRKLTPGKGVLEMLFNTVSARRDPARAFATLERVAAQATMLKGIRGETSDVVPVILRKMDQIAAQE